MKYLEVLEQSAINQLVNASSTEEVLDAKGRISAFHKVITTLTSPVKESDNAK